MGIKSVLLAGKFMAAKLVVFITGLLTLFIMGKAFGLDAVLEIRNVIPQGHPYYSKKGYTIAASGHGICMHGVYSPASCNVTYENGTQAIGLHYKAAWGCAFEASAQNFKVINNDTGEIFAMFRWEEYAHNCGIILVESPANFIVAPEDTDHFKDNRLNIVCDMFRM
ncbi:hypothetical protein [Candidatus Sororendozoicomonas aggregata]|uniref:hypothetical protein n=1 Tax=Candidatus Sororendozoicomonas aggregata TaxID=3073239 RepID=UPI002ED40777